MKPKTRIQAKQMVDDDIWSYAHKQIQLNPRMTPLEKRALVHP